mmetsp:Transcript_26615/g.83277  ORF Transcript_26615/g.83277 Transcript_26615/m.83277 type:complete len:226 (-) Transcript_26615:285-962(-)
MSSRMVRMPPRCSMRSTTGWLSMNSMGGKSTPSARYTASSFLNVSSLKSCCSFSFVKLMQSCSKEFVSKISNPKMSRMPMNRAPALPPAGRSDALMRSTSQSKRRSYTNLARASRFSSACSTRSGTVKSPWPRMCMVRFTRARCKLSSSTPNSRPAHCALGMVSGSMSEPSEAPAVSGVKWTLPRCRIPATMLMMLCCLLSSNPSREKAPMTSSNSCTSSMPSTS